MSNKYYYLFLIFTISFQGYSQDSKTLENEKINSLLYKIDSIQENKPELEKIFKFQIGQLYYDLFAEEFDWYGGESYDKVQAKDWFNTAITYLEQSSRNGCVEAQHALGVIYSNTPDYNGDPDNYNDGEKAIYWFSKAANQGNVESMYDLALVYYTGNGGNESVKNDDKAMHWFEKAAQAGYGVAQSKLGDIFYNGKIVPEDKEKAFFWYKKANNHGFGLSRVGRMYYYGIGTTQSYAKAYEMFKRLWEMYPPDDKIFNDATACYYLGLLYYYGDHVEEDRNKAFNYIEQSAMIGHSGASAMLGYLHYYGDGTLVDKDLAFTWLKRGAKSGDYEQTQYLLGRMYFYGEATSVDKKMAAYWMKKAFKNGSEEAKKFWDKNDLWKYK